MNYNSNAEEVNRLNLNNVQKARYFEQLKSARTQEGRRNIVNNARRVANRQRKRAASMNKVKQSFQKAVRVGYGLLPNRPTYTDEELLSVLLNIVLIAAIYISPAGITKDKQEKFMQTVIDKLRGKLKITSVSNMTTKQKEVRLLRNAKSLGEALKSDVFFYGQGQTPSIAAQYSAYVFNVLTSGLLIGALMKISKTLVAEKMNKQNFVRKFFNAFETLINYVGVILPSEIATKIKFGELMVTFIAHAVSFLGLISTAKKVELEQDAALNLLEYSNRKIWKVLGGSAKTVAVATVGGAANVAKDFVFNVRKWMYLAEFIYYMIQILIERRYTPNAITQKALKKFFGALRTMFKKGENNNNNNNKGPQNNGGLAPANLNSARRTTRQVVLTAANGARYRFRNQRNMQVYNGGATGSTDTILTNSAGVQYRVSENQLRDAERVRTPPRLSMAAVRRIQNNAPPASRTRRASTPNYRWETPSPQGSPSRTRRQ